MEHGRQCLVRREVVFETEVQPEPKIRVETMGDNDSRDKIPFKYGAR